MVKRISNYIKKKIGSLEYKVYINNNHEIKEYNIFNHPYLKEKLYEFAYKYKKDQNLEQFISDFDSILKYCFWSKCEWETILTSWPPHIELNEFDRIREEIVNHDKEWGYKQLYGCNVNLSVAEKIDVYDQIRLHWDLFIDYVVRNALC